MITNSITSLSSIIRGLIQDPLRTDGRQVFTYKTDNKFKLSKDYVSSSTITVTINGISTSNFVYDSDTGYVTVTGLTLNDIVIISYSYYKEYSDNEISGYITSSLSYFPMYQYIKTFYINEDDEVVAINNYEPTTNELYFIAIIASILINPQNIHIKIPDLDISAKRDKSDQEQIEDAFLKFQSFSGLIDAYDILVEE